ncbi:hypothetical protein [Amaricoccus sp. W119]|uniref:hypothetical protein n=1 Tax=Amaricoccus sp. W119 TaxID=3391833 RepID=UPI0039A776BD
MDRFREGICALVSVLIAGVATWMLIDAYTSGKAANTPASIEAFGRQKDMLLLALGLLGTVTGYYFGRVPAEKNADASKREADQANATLDATKKAAGDASTVVEESLQAMNDELAGGGKLDGNELLKTLKFSGNRLRAIAVS